MRHLIALAAAFQAAACTTSSAPDASAPSIDQVKVWTVSAKSRIFVDPDSVRDVTIGPPYINFVGQTAVCLGANSRNQMGGYTGYRFIILTFSREGQFALAREPNAYDATSCSQAGMAPFPEISKPLIR